MGRKETSDRVSAIAADLSNITLADLQQYMAREGGGDELVVKIRSVANSVRSQDETKGKRK